MLNDKDPFGFADAIQIDHLTNEEIQIVLEMFGDKN
jgi:hypothetical protein